ncbi:MAG: hypothetical protein LBD97_03970 [Bifidobacteriaceae bacterium]|nr:hypothetical protein [Bifidobacteriaceae bacterium]
MVVGVEHVGCAHDDARLVLLVEAAGERLGLGQGVLGLGLLPRAALWATSAVGAGWSR